MLTLKGKNPHHFSEVKFLSDGSTDSAIIEEEIIYAQYAKKGEVFVQFVRLESVAQHIAAAITSGVTKGLALEEVEWKRKLVAVGTDGAAVMLGRVSGVVVRVTEGLPMSFQFTAWLTGWS